MHITQSRNGYIRALILYSLIPPSALVMSLVLFDPYQVIRPQFGMRNLLANLTWGLPAMSILWMKVWIHILIPGSIIVGTVLLINRYPRAAKTLVAIFLGAAMGLLICVSLDSKFMNWRDIPLGAVVPWCYAMAGAIGGGTLISLTSRSDQQAVDSRLE